MSATFLAKNLKKLLQMLDISPSRLSRESGIDLPRISRMMAGHTVNPTVRTLQPIAKFFGITIDQLIENTDFKTEDSQGVVVAAERSMVPLLEWKHCPYWKDVKENFHPSQTIDVAEDITEDSFALLIESHEYMPRFNEGDIIIVDPNRQEKNRDYMLTFSKELEKVTIVQVIKECGNTFFKSVSLNPQLTNIDYEYVNYGVVCELKVNFSHSDS